MVVAPFALLAILSAAFFVSTLLRPAESVPERSLLLTVSGALVVVGLLAGGLTHVLWGRVQLPLRVAAALHIGLLSVLSVVVSAIAVHDGGLGSSAAAAFLLLGPYIALVAPRALVWPALALMLTLLAAVGATGGTGPPHTAPVLALMVIACFVGGRLPRVGQELAAVRASRAARSDALTALLNRRGFEEEAEWVLGAGAAEAVPVALLMIDLNGFKLVNDAQGHAAGDELLAWVGGRLVALAAPDAVVGRVGGDEFAVLLPGASEAAAEAAAGSLRAALAERVGTSVGVAVRHDGAADLPALLRTADEAMYRAKADPSRRVQVRDVTHAIVPRPAPRPWLTFAELRRRRPAADAPIAIADPHWVLHGHLVSAVTGTVVIGAAWLWGGDSPWEVWLRWFGLVWIGICAVYAVSLARHPVLGDRPVWWRLDIATGLAALGALDAALAGGGSLAPVAGAFYLAVLHDTSILSTRDAARSGAILLAFWAGVVVLGPASLAWAVPFELSLFVAAFALGWIGRRVLVDAGREEHRLATVDPLTGLLNRRAFIGHVERARLRAAHAAGALLAVDLDDFKAVNDRFGHATGDRLLVEVAETLRSTLGDRWVVGRIGGDEFGAVSLVADRRSYARKRSPRDGDRRAARRA